MVAKLKFKDLSDEMKANVLEVIANESNYMNGTTEYTAESSYVNEIASDYEYEVTGTGSEDWEFV